MTSPMYPDWLIERAFGGTCVADTPGSDAKSSRWPAGESPPAAAEACAALLEHCNRETGDGALMLTFLVGGAGNGKSYLAKKFTNELAGQRIGSRAKFASRNYDYQLEGGRLLRVVNDATIPPKDAASKDKDYLISDVQYCLDRRAHLLACVNRGILLNEAQAQLASGTEFGEIAQSVVHSLISQRVPGTVVTVSGESLDNVEAGFEFAYEVQVQKDLKACIRVVFMDRCSLFEPFPSVDLSPPLEGANPETISQQNFMPISDPARAAAALPGKQVLQLLIEELQNVTDPMHPLDPFRANLRCFSNSQVVGGFCNLLRGGEIVSGERFSYRDLWGLVVLALLGGINRGDLSSHEQVLLRLFKSIDNGATTERLHAVMSLALRRSHMTIFSARGPDCIFDAAEQPVIPSSRAVAVMEQADPLRCQSDDSLRVIREKLVLLEENVGPGQALANENEDFASVWTELDHTLEETLLSWLYDDKEAPEFSARNEVLAWYGQYLARLFAFSKGEPAFADLIALYASYWNKAYTKQDVPRDLEAGLNELLLTRFAEDQEECYLPIFAARVNPITAVDVGGSVALAIESREYFWSQYINGTGAIAVELKAFKNPDETISSFILDFAMLREADACRNGGGFTEHLHQIEPRVERVRASMLVAAMRRTREEKRGMTVRFLDGSRVL